ncbi:histidine kinase [Parapedobacter tibetensis]|uniref:histidine kinase n=1 Tax=Parapedobacter tibetensis TaxID=2972951 RepID=UPI00214D64E4|nr:histidine kinase [Parapedobacter tibetensis]
MTATVQKISRWVFTLIHSAFITSFLAINISYNIMLREHVNMANVVLYSFLALAAIYILMGCFYLLFSGRRWGWGVLLLTAMVIVLVFFSHRLIYDVFPQLLDIEPSTGQRRPLREFIVMSIPRLYYYTAIALLFVAFHRLSQALVRRANAEKVALQAEVDRLKAEKMAQEMEMRAWGAYLNPHLLYNELDGIEGELVSWEDPRAEQLAHRVRILADTLRYNARNVLENRSIVVFEKELDQLERFLEARNTGQPDFKATVLDVHGEVAGQKIVPMTLVYLAENAFKHGDFRTEPLKISVHLTDDQLVACFRNRIRLGASTDRSLHSGMDVIKRRLELAMPGRYHITTKEENGDFEVTVSIDQNV